MASEGSERFRANLAALAEADPELARRVEETPYPSACAVRTASGHVTLRVASEAGSPLYLHSRRDPVAEGQAQVASLDLDGVSGLVVYGLGAGYHVEALLARAGRACRVAVFERSLAHLRFALESFDWAGAIRARRLLLLADLPRPETIRRLEGHTLYFFGRTEVFAHGASLRAYPAYYASARQTVEEFFGFAKMHLYTLSNLSLVTMLNVCLNLPSFLASPGVRELEGAAKGYPAVLVGAGPSLARNIHLLNEAARGAVLISVPTVFRTLLSRGIVPDFVTTLDYHKISAKYYEGLPAGLPVTLVCDPKVSYAVVDAYRGPKRFADHPFLRDLLGDAALEKGTLRWGSTVAHLSLYLAEHLGADPIVFVGQDLCYPFGVTHMPGTPIHEEWVPELNRFSTFEMKEWETLLRVRPILRKVQDASGRSVYTDEQMFSYLVRFEEDFTRVKGRVIDATEGGLAKRGAERLPLAEVIRSFCGNPFPRERLRQGGGGGAGPAAFPRAAERIRARSREVEEIQAYYARMGELLAAVHRCLEAGESPSKAIRLVRLEADRIEGFLGIHKLVSALAQVDEFRRVKADLLLLAEGVQGAERQRRELARDQAYMEGCRRAAETLRALLAASLERLEAFERGVEPPTPDLGPGGILNLRNKVSG